MFYALGKDFRSTIRAGCQNEVYESQHAVGSK